jgi:hypothetical protein
MAACWRARLRKLAFFITSDAPKDHSGLLARAAQKRGVFHHIRWSEGPFRLAVARGSVGVRWLNAENWALKARYLG